MSILFADERDDPREIEESAQGAFEEVLHPRNRRGEFTFKVGDLVKQKGYGDQHFNVIGHWRGQAKLEHPVLGTTHHAQEHELSHVGMHVTIHDRPQKAMFEKGDRVVLKDGREGTILWATGGKQFGGFRDSDTWVEPKYTVSTPKPEVGTKGYLAEEVTYGGEKMSRGRMIVELQKAAAIQFPGDSTQQQAMVDRHMQGYEHRGGGYEQVQVMHGDLRYHPDEMAARQETISGLQAKAAAGKFPARTLPVRKLPVTLGGNVVPDEWQVEHGYAEWGSSLRPIFGEGGRHRVGHEEEKFARMKPGTNVEKMIFHYLVGHPAPPNFPEGSQAHAQWTYTGTGGKKADREALLRKITQALDARERGYDDLYAEFLQEALDLRENVGPLVLEEFAFPWTEAKHPRDRVGKFSEVVGRLALLHRQLGGRGSTQQRLDDGSITSDDVRHLSALAENARGQHRPGTRQHSYVHEVANEIDHHVAALHAIGVVKHQKRTRELEREAARGEVFHMGARKRPGRDRAAEQDERWSRGIGEADVLGLAEAFEEVKHPRGRGGQWTAVLGKVKALGHMETHTTPHGYKIQNRSHGKVFRTVAPNGHKKDFHTPEEALHAAGHYEGSEVSSDSAVTKAGLRSQPDELKSRSDTAAFRSHPNHPAAEEAVEREGYLDARAGKEPRASVPEHMKAAYLRGHAEGKKLSKKHGVKKPGSLGLYGNAHVKRVSESVADEIRDLVSKLKTPCDCGADNLPHEHGSACPAVPVAVQESAVLWNPSLHPRERGGRFAEVLNALKMNGGHDLGHGVRIERGRILGWKVHHPDGTSKHIGDAEQAVQHALSVHLDGARQEQGKFFMARYSLGDRSVEHDPARRVGTVRTEHQRGVTSRLGDATDAMLARGEVAPRHVDLRVSKAQALVDAGLADDLADARAQLADMGEGGGMRSPGRTMPTAGADRLAREQVTVRGFGGVTYTGAPEILHVPGHDPVTGSKLSSRIDVMNRIVDRHQAEEVDGVLVDVQTANLLRQIHAGLRPENRDRFEKMPMSRLADVAWQSVR